MGEAAVFGGRVDLAMRRLPLRPHRRQGGLDGAAEAGLQRRHRLLLGAAAARRAGGPAFGGGAGAAGGGAQRAAVHRDMPALMRLHLAEQAGAGRDLLGDADQVLGLHQGQRHLVRRGADAAMGAERAGIDLAVPLDAGDGERQVVQGGAARPPGFRMQRVDAEAGVQHRLRVHHREPDARLPWRAGRPGHGCGRLGCGDLGRGGRRLGRLRQGGRAGQPQGQAEARRGAGAPQSHPLRLKYRIGSTAETTISARANG
ncbi:hypothetical protein [Siccirubricoccus sp. G192]|uniref:hypothetical protein n=1 Tax=Siccirubricoccus sp. G192 TaxID=2849651 RepID=UPI0020C275D0|nr:hypothetical protein [Siccirubricoccus sp. G192]